MIGLSILIILVIYIYIGYKAVNFVLRKTQKKLYWVLTVAFFILLPTWDVIIGKLYFNYICKTEGGLKVYKTIKADGFLDTQIPSEDKPSSLDLAQAKDYLDYGFHFYEIPTFSGGFLHFTKDSNGIVSYKVVVKPESRYVYLVKSDEVISYILGIKKQEVQTFKDIVDGSLIAQTTWIVRDGWIGNVMNVWLGKGLGEGCYTTNRMNFKYQILKGDFHE